MNKPFIIVFSGARTLDRKSPFGLTCVLLNVYGYTIKSTIILFTYEASAHFSKIVKIRARENNF